MSKDVAALWRFHLASGARVALRASIPIAGMFVVAVGLSEYPGATLASFVASAAATNPDTLFAAGTAALALGLAAWAAPRVAAGSLGWMRSLPVDARTQGRAMALGIAASLFPLTLALLLAVTAAGVYGRGWNVARACALIPLSLGAAYAALPVERRWLVAPLAFAGAVVAIAGGFIHAATGAALVVAADALAGPVGDSRTRTYRGFRFGRGLPWMIALRALRTGVLGAWMAGALPLLAGVLFLVNNDLPAALSRRGARLAIGVAIVVTLASLADRLALARPPWPWSRSLPWSSRRRVVDDALVLAALVAPIVVAGIVLDAPSGLLALVFLPAAALRAVAALRHTGDGRTAVSGPILIEGGLGAVVFASTPWMAVAALTATPWLLRVASLRDANWKVGRWTAVNRPTSGDPADWTGQ